MEFMFSYDVALTKGGTPFHVELDIITADSANDDGSFNITSISGTWNGQKVLGLAPKGGTGGNDNEFFPNDDSQVNVNGNDYGDGKGYASNHGFDFTVAYDPAQAGQIDGDDGKGVVNFFEALSGVDNEFPNPMGAPVMNEVLVKVPCFHRGARIATEGGEVAVEDLSIGDRVVTLSGDLRPIRWIGRRSYAGRFAAGNPAVWPVSIRAGALADNLPRRDLLVSPKHGLLLDGLIVPAIKLVNGCTIAQTRGSPRIEYFHLELEEHDVIFAEGAPAETFVDDESRTMFQNYGEYAELYGDVAAAPALYCAPRMEEGPQIDAIRHRLALRASGVDLLAA